jgi:hypothetical protein
VIRSFRHKGVERFFTTSSKAGIQAAPAPRLARQLAALTVATQAATATRNWSITRTTTEVSMSEMHNPSHPGLTLRDDVLPALGLQVGEAATQLGVTEAVRPSDGLRSRPRKISGRHANPSRRQRHWPE